MNPETKRKIEEQIGKITNTKESQTNSSEGFKKYFENRFESHGETEYKNQTENVKGRESGVCSSASQIPKTVSQMIPSFNFGANMIEIKNKSYFDFDLTIDVLFKIPTKIGIAFRMKDQYNFYAFVIDSHTRSKSLMRIINGRPTVLKSIEDGGIIIGDWHTIHITARTGNIKVFIYDADTVSKKSSEKILESYDNTFTQGGVGIISEPNEGFCFDKLNVESQIVWTPWASKKGIKVIQATSGSFNEGILLF